MNSRQSIQRAQREAVSQAHIPARLRTEDIIMYGFQPVVTMIAKESSIISMSCLLGDLIEEYEHTDPKNFGRKLDSVANALDKLAYDNSHSYSDI